MIAATLTLPSNVVHGNERIRADVVTATPRTKPVPCRVVALTSELRRDYDAYVNASADGTLFHTCGWLDSIRATFPHEPVQLVAVQDDPTTNSVERVPRIVGMLPLFLVRSRLGGRMMVSVPYAVGGGILADDPDVATRLFAEALIVAESERVRCVELRSRAAVIPGIPVDDRYVTFERELPSRADDVPDWLPRKARAAARNGADKFQLTIEYGAHHLGDVWKLYTSNMRRLASIAYPFRFFDEFTGALADRTWISLVRRNGQPVAGLVTFLFRDRVMPYFFGCSADARRCSAANFIYFKTMDGAVAAGYRVFDFGRSRRDNAGSYDFKRFHGFEPTPLMYQRFIAGGAAAPDLSPNSARFRVARRIWPFLPLRLTQIAGGLLSRHIPG